jgi:hypothetical protein
MKRILVFSPDNDPTSFYRGARPWQLLERKLNQGYPYETYKAKPGSTLVQVIPPGPHNDYIVEYVSRTTQRPLPAEWDQAGFYDLVFMQRPNHPNLLQACMNFKRMGSKIWIDEDDLQTDVPWDMPSAYLFNTKEMQDTIRGCLQLADVVTVASDYLGEKLKDFTKSEIVTVPNAFDLETFPKPEPKPKKKLIIWRGAAPSHLANLMSVRKELFDVMCANPEWKLLFFGMMPWWYNAFKDEFPIKLQNVGYAAHTPTLFDYYETLKQMNPAIWICPLVDNDFNRCRSNNAWMDASWIGAQVLAPIFNQEIEQAWSLPGLIRNYDAENPKGFGPMLQALMKENKGEEYASKSWDYITKNLLLPKINEKRLEIVKRLIG